MTNILQTDVLVIGGGGAASRAAIEARLAGAGVILVTKGTFGTIGTRGSGATNSALSPFGILATPGWAGDLSGGEKALAHMIAAPKEQSFFNIIQVGLGMADPKLARILVEDAVETRASLLKWGATFGQYGIKSHGAPIMEALEGLIRDQDVLVIERTMMIGLIVQDGECIGSIGVNEINGDILIIKARATVIGTGGDAGLFMLNLNPPCNTGDGYVIGYEAGAELMNLEFKQIFLGTVYPTKNMITSGLPPYVRLTNVRGEEFLQDYLPVGASVEECLSQRQLHAPFSTRDALSRYVDIGIISEVKAGRGTEHQGIYLDRRDCRIPPLPILRNEFWLYRGVDFTRNLVEMGICHHSSLGGFRIDENAQTTLPRLYAAGEVAAGPHGADRIGGHMLLASQVFGARAGRHAAKQPLKDFEVDNQVLLNAEERIKNLGGQKGDIKPEEVKRKLQESAYYNLLVTRSEASLNNLLADVKDTRKELKHLSVTSHHELIEALELENLLLLAEVEAKVCLERKESRGPHYREDFPSQDDKNWLRTILVSKTGGALQIKTVALDSTWHNRGDEKLKHWA